MENDTTTLDQVLAALGYSDVLDYFSSLMNSVGGDTYSTADTLFSVNDTMIGQVSEIVNQLNDLINSGALQATNQVMANLNLIHAASQGLGKINNYLTNVETAEGMDDLSGGLALVGNTAGNTSDLLGAASSALAILAALVAPEAAAAILIASASLNMLSNTLALIQRGVGNFDNLVSAIDNALEQAQNNSGGEPLVFGDQGGSTNGTYGSGNSGYDPVNPSADPIVPVTFTSDDNWQTIKITPNQQDGFSGTPFTPPSGEAPSTSTTTATSPSTSTPYNTNSGGGGDGWDNGIGRRYPELDKMFNTPPDPTGPGAGSGNIENGAGNGYGPGGPGGNDKTKRDPLILDLDGDGIELTEVGAPPVFFDADGDGVAVLTGWVDPDDGLLARDLDGNGLIETQAELFGTSSVDAISDLAAQDSNNDGMIDANDDIWSDLRVWRDLNQDGISSANELQTMEEAALLNISLNQQLSGAVVGDNLIHSTTTFETVAGEIGTAAAVLFGVNTLYSQTTETVVFEQGSPFLDIPNVKGFGALSDLRMATYDDPTLLALVQALVADPESLSGGEFHARLEELALRWAGVEAVDPGSDPTSANLQHEAFLTVFRGTERPDTTNAAQRALVSAEESFHAAINSIALRFGIEITNASLSETSTGAEISAAIDSPFFALSFIDVSSSTGIISGGLERVIYEIASRLPDDVDAAINKLDAIMPLLSAFRDEYFLEEGSRIDTTFKNEDFDSFVLTALNQYIDNPTLVQFAFSALNSGAHFLGTDGDDVGAAVFGAAMTSFSRTLVVDLGEGDDALNVQAVNAYTGTWDVSYVYREGDGSDTIDVTQAEGLHKLFLTDINADQVVLTRTSIDGVLTLYNGETITFAGLFSNTISFDRELTVYTADGQEISTFGSFENGVFLSTAADDFATGTVNIADSYYYSVGDGADTITEPYTNNDATVDKVVLGDINKSDLIITIDGNDLVLTFANGQSGDSVRLVNQLSPNGYFSNDPAWKVEEIHFADGEVVAAQTLVNMAFAAQSTGGDDIINGLRFADLILLSDGTDSAHGGANSDTYVRGATVTGTTTIEDNSTVGSDTLIIEGFASTDAIFTRSGNDVTITLPNGAVVLANQMATNTSDVIEQLIFTDGPMTATEITALVTPSTGTFADIIGTASDETLAGTNTDERLDGLAGDDILRGGQGSDTYVIRNSSGNDTIDEAGTTGASSVDRVYFADITAAEVSLTRGGNNLLVEVLATGQIITIDQHFVSETVGVEYFEFSDSTVWDRAEILDNSYIVGTSAGEIINGTTGQDNILGLEGNDDLRGNRGHDTYVFHNGDGEDTVTDARHYSDATVVNTVHLTETNLADLRIELVNDGYSISDVLLRYGATDSVLINNGFSSNADIRSIQQVVLADDTILTHEDLIAQAVLYGTDGDDVMTGAVRVDGMAGDDVITGFGSDTDFIWREGSGNDTIINRDYDGGSGRLVLEGINRADVSFSRTGLDMVITLVATGETITVENQFYQVSSGRKAGVGEVVFEDGGLLRDAVANASLETATAGVDVITGGWDSEFIRGQGGDDILNGGQGSDLYVWQTGDGNDVITDNSGGFDTVDVLQLTDVASIDDVAFSRANGTSYDLVITITATGETITLVNQLGYDNNGLERIQFSDGSAVSLAGIEPLVSFADVAGTGVVEGDYLNNILEGLAGDDVLNGMEGSDTYVWTRGDGNDIINETITDNIWVEDPESEEGGYTSEVEVSVESPNDQLWLEGVRADDVSFERPAGTDDLIITVLDTGETITIIDHFIAILTGIESILFEDDLFGRADIFAQIGGETLTGDGSDQTLSGGATSDLFTLSTGDEIVQTGGGRDTIVIGEDGGNDRIEGFQRGVGGTTVELPTSAIPDFDALLAAASDTTDGVLIDLGGGNQVLLTNVFVSDLEPDNFGFQRAPIFGTEGDDDLFGTLLDDTINLLGGDDRVQGNAGNDMIDAGGGYDVAYFNGASTDYTITRNGNEVVVTDTNPDDGNDGTDTIVSAELLSFLGDGVTVSLVNQAPVASTDGNAVTLDEDTIVSGAIPAATDPENDTPLSYILTGPAPAGLVVNLDGTFDYTPPADFNGDVSFDYVVSDPDGATSDPATFTFTVTPINDAPDAAVAGNAATLDEDSTLSGALPSATDIDGDTGLTFAVTGATPAGLVVNLDGTFDYTPPANFNGDVSFDYVVSDPDGAISDPATFTFTVTPINDAPMLVIQPVDQAGEAGEALDFTLPTNTFSDVDNATLTLTASQANGDALPDWLTFNAAALSFVGTPPIDFSGTLALQVLASDGALSVDAEFDLEIIAVPQNLAPISNDDGGFEVTSGTEISIAGGDLLANDSDPEGDALSITSVGAAEHGTVEIVGTDILFTADVGYTGAATFDYTISDGAQESTASVSLDVISEDPYAGFVQGTEGSDWMFGNYWSSNQIYGAGGNDLIAGGRRDDHLVGGAGSDRLFGRSGDDLIEGGDGNDLLYGGRGENRLEGNDGNDRLFGGRDNDTLLGGEGSDRLFGYSGDDIIDGGGGNDLVYGGRGDDVFIFAEGSGSDRIRDFSAGTWWRGDDIIQLDIEGIDNFEDLLETSSGWRSASFDFGDGDVLTLQNVRLSSLSESDFVFI